MHTTMFTKVKMHEKEAHRRFSSRQNKYNASAIIIINEPTATELLLMYRANQMVNRTLCMCEWRACCRWQREKTVESLTIRLYAL